MSHIFEKHKAHWDKNYTHAVITGFVLLIAALILNFFASRYAAQSSSVPVTDLLLDHLPVFDVDGIIIVGSFALILFIAILIILDPRKIPFVTKASALFILIRAAFITLTHIAPYPYHDHVATSPLLQALTLDYTADLFFSGHAGLPFLMALIFWEDKIYRYLLLASSVILGVSVILGHYHYSIDVFAAYFITYSIFHIVQIIFPGDWKLASA